MRLTGAWLFLVLFTVPCQVMSASSPPNFETASEAFDYVGENTVEDGDLAIDSVTPLQVRVLVESFPGDRPEVVRQLGERAALMAVFTVFIYTDTVDSIDVSAYARPLDAERLPTADPTQALVTLRATRAQATHLARTLMGVSELGALVEPSPYSVSDWVFAPALSRALSNDQGPPTRDEVIRHLSVRR